MVPSVDLCDGVLTDCGCTFATALVLKATGKEKVEWRETQTEIDDDGNSINKYEDHESDKEFFKQKVSNYHPHTRRCRQQQHC